MAESQTLLELMGVPGSPYTRKMLALLRYRRLPYRLLPSSRHQINPEPQRYRPRPEPRVALMPTFYMTDAEGAEQAVCDSTPLIREFEKLQQERSVIPESSVLAFIDYLIEDYADEWLTKAMFHYRWTYPADIKKAGELLPRWSNITASEQRIAEQSRSITERQISRLRYVGSSEITRSTIEQSFERFISLLDKHLQQLPFLLGKRPAACDFAVYGQLTCMALFDPTPQQIILQTAPRVYAWTELLEDLSGYETLSDDWIDIADFPATLTAILEEIGHLYVPYLLANAVAVENKQEQLDMELDGRPWQQNPFPYQAKCLHKIRDVYAQLSDLEKENDSDEATEKQHRTRFITNEEKLMVDPSLTVQEYQKRLDQIGRAHV